MAEKIDLKDNSHVIVFEGIDGRESPLRVDMFHFMAAIEAAGPKERVPFGELVGIVRAAVGAEASGLDERTLYSIGRHMLERLNAAGN